MDNTKISDTVITLSSFYELLLNIGKSFDVQENAEEFLKTLMLQKELSFAAYFTFEYPNKLHQVYAIPKVKTEYQFIDESLHDSMVKNKFVILDANHPSFNQLSALTPLPPKEFVVYYTGVKCVIILAKKKGEFVVQNLIKYELVLNHFALFMESLESHHAIKEEIRIKQAQAKIIEKNNEKLKKQNDDLLNYFRSNSELQQFAYRVSHDLNAPLRSIIQFSKILEDSTGDTLSQDQKEYLQFILNSGNQMKELITGILDYSKITGSKLKLKQIDVNKLIEKIRKLLYHNLSEANGTIVVKDVPQTIVADETKMMQLFLNLISNALKFKKENEDAEIIITGQQQGNEFTFSIADNGIGISKENQDKIFDLFNKAQHEFDGHGIGLSTCKQILEQHNGQIWVTSNINQGATFHFKFKGAGVATATA